MILEETQDFNTITEARQLLLESETLADWADIMYGYGYRNYMYYLKEFAKAHEQLHSSLKHE